MDIFHYFDSISVGSLSLSSILSAILIFLICLAVIKLIMRGVSKFIARTHLDDALKRLVCSVCKTVLWVVAIIMVGGALGVDTASLVALVSIAGLALSLAIQNVMANIFSGIMLLVIHPFKAGDYVDIGSNSGTVKHIGLFYTSVDTVDNKIVSIPNSDVTSAAVVNYSAEPQRRLDMKFGASYDAPTQDVRDAISDAIAMDKRILNTPAPFITISAYKDSSIEYLVRMWCKNEDYWDIYFAMNEHVRDTFASHGVEMSYEHLNVHIMK